MTKLELAIKRVQEAREMTHSYVVSGGPPTYDEYKHATGVMKGLDRAIFEMLEVQKMTENQEQDDE